MAFCSGKVSHAFFKMGKRVRWIKGEELDKILAAEAAVDLFAVQGVSTDMLLGRLREAKEHRVQREAAKKEFKIAELHVDMGTGLDEAKQRGSLQRAKQAEVVGARPAKQASGVLLPQVATGRSRDDPATHIGGGPVSSAASADDEHSLRFGRHRAGVASSGAGED